MAEVEAEERVGEEGLVGAECAAPADVACSAAPSVAAGGQAALRGHRSLTGAQTSPSHRSAETASGTCTSRASSSPRRPRPASACPGASACIRPRLRARAAEGAQSCPRTRSRALSTSACSRVCRMSPPPAPRSSTTARRSARLAPRQVAVKEVAYRLAQWNSNMGESAGEDEGRGDIEDEDKMYKFQSVKVRFDSLRGAGAGCPLVIIGAVIKPLPSLRTSSRRTFGDL
jgi:hypothetical protein